VSHETHCVVFKVNPVDPGNRPDWFLRAGVAVVALAAACRHPGSAGQDVPLDRVMKIVVENPSDIPRALPNFTMAVAELAAAARDFNPNCIVLYDGDVEVPVQADDLNLDGAPDVIAFQAPSLKPKERRVLQLFYNPGRNVLMRYPKRAHAAVRPEFEGPGWESDLIGYRLYLDGRNAIDVFGKSEAGLSLDRYALDPAGYHAVQPWGVDVLHVGDTLGGGSFGFWADGAVVKPVETQRTKDLKALRRYVEVVADGPARAIVRITWDNWVVDGAPRTVRATMTIWGGRRWATCDLEVAPGWRPTVAAGVVAVAGAPMVKKSEYFYTYGDQTDPMSDTGKPEALGLAILFRKENFAAFVEEAPTAGALASEDRSRVVLLTPDAQGRLRWAYLAAWGRGALGIRDAAAFEKECEGILAEFHAPLRVGLESR
jgi:hypothetical protein